jgi:pimeloyl-ACP methyl ester carboxylesterase
MPGLFGSKQNFRSISKALSLKLQRPIYSLDLRNHGDSPHSQVHTLQAMADDVDMFVKRHDIQSADLVGHSMGGKVLMHIALSHVPWLRRSVVVDMSPVPQPIKTSSAFADYIRIMQTIQSTGAKSAKEADSIMAQHGIKEIAVRQFLLTNLKSYDGVYKFRINLDALEHGLKDIWLFLQHTEQYDGKMLFLRGSRSGYVPESHYPQIKDMFPNAVIQSLDAGHWVHAERSREFIDAVAAFLGDDDRVTFNKQ